MNKHPPTDALSVATGGAGAALIGVSAGGLTGMMASAAFTSLVSQATISMINNQGNLSKVVKDLTTSQAMISTLTSVASAGISHEFGLSSLNTKTFTDHLQNAGVQCIAPTTVSVLRNPDLKQALKQGLLDIGVAAVGSYGAKQIGGLRHPTDKNTPPISWIQHKFLHGILGAAMGTALSKDRMLGALSGGFGGAFSEIIAEQITPSKEELYQGIVEDNRKKGIVLTEKGLKEAYRKAIQLRIDISRMTTATLLLLARGDITVGDITGSNALQNNHFPSMMYKFGELAYNYAETNYPEETEIVKKKVSEGVKETRGYLLNDLEDSVRIQKNDQKTFESSFHETNQILKDPSLPWWKVVGGQRVQINNFEALGRTHFYPTNRLDYGFIGLDLATLGSGTGLFGRAASMTKNIGNIAFLGNKVRQTAKIPLKQFGQNTFQTMMPQTNISNMSTLGLGYASTGGETITNFAIEGEKILSQVSKTIGKKIETFSNDLVKNHKLLQEGMAPSSTHSPFLVVEEIFEQKAINLNKGSSNISNTSQLLTKNNPSTASPFSKNFEALDLPEMKILRGTNGKIKGVTNTQKHHIIHEKLGDHKFWELAGRNIQEKKNRMLLPNKEGKKVTTTKRSVHQGRHTDEVRLELEEELNKAVRQGKQENWLQEQYSKKLDEIIATEKMLLKKGERNLYN